MFNQTPFNATALNADDGGGGSVDATVTLTGFDVAIEFGNLVAFEFITDRGGFGKQDRVLEPIEHVYPVDAVACLTGIEVGADPRVQQLHAILTELINDWRLDDMNKQEYNPKVEG